MKKAALIIGTLVVAAVLFLVSMAVFVKVRGGLSADHGGLSRMPLVGGLLEAPPAPEPEAAEGEPAAAGELPARREMPFLRFGVQARLERLAEELEVKRTDYEESLRQLERKSRELDAWERQLKEERDALRARFGKEKEELTLLKEDLARREAELGQRRVVIEQSEETNLKKTAEIYGKMEPTSAAGVLGEMYANGQQETVVKIIYLMEDRSAAKTLEAITDPKIVAQITEELKNVETPVQQGG